MPKLTDHHSGKFTKLLYLGDSGTGKTGSLTSLVKAGYQLRILDFDNGLDVLKEFVKRDCPEKLSNVDYETQRDPYKAGPMGPVVAGTPKALVNSLKLLTKWSDDTVPSEWGANYIFVMDSLTGLGKAAFEWAKSVNPGAKDPRQWYHGAQQAVDNVISLLTSEAFHANVIIIAHVQLVDQNDGTVRGYANTIGKALGPMIPTYFNTMVLAKSSGAGQNVKREIVTVPTSLIDLKSPAPFKVDATLPLSTGLASIFEKLKEL
jgi:hypothetical protein